MGLRGMSSQPSHRFDLTTLTANPSADCAVLDRSTRDHAACCDGTGRSLPKREFRAGFTEPALSPKCSQTGDFGPNNSPTF